MDTQTRTLEKIVKSQHFLKTKVSNGPITSINLRTVSWDSCIVQPWILLVHLQEKNLENLLFSENVVTGQSSSKCPSWSVHTVIMDLGKWIKYWTRVFTKFCPVLLKFCLYQSFVLMSINKQLFVPLQLGFLWQVMLSKTFVTGH